MLLSGTVWVDSSNYHLVHLDADLLQPISEAKLTFLHQSIDYGAVPFGARHMTLWLPKTADVTAEFNGQRLRERRSYTDFALFAVETGEQAPKKPAHEKISREGSLRANGILGQAVISNHERPNLGLGHIFQHDRRNVGQAQ